MNSFWTRHWWAIPAWVLGMLALFFVLNRARRNPDAKLSRTVFWLFPLLNPDRQRPPVRLQFVLLVVLVLVLLAMFEH